MHVALNALFLTPPMGGLETYVRELCRELLQLPDAPRITVYANPAGHAKLIREDWAGDARIVNASRLGRNGVKALSELGPLGPVADRAGADVIHSVALTGPLASRAKRVVTIADITWITHPEDTATQRLWRTLVPLVVRRAHEVVTISEYAARQVEGALPVKPDHFHVTPLAGHPPAAVPATPEAELRDRLGLGDGPIVLNVGQRGGHRNLARLIDAVALVRDTLPGTVLVMPGYAPPEADEPLKERARERGVADAVHFVGYMSAEDLDGLYRAAGAFAMPSLVEGFGLPVVEAMQRGTPVACTRDSAPSEVMGDAGVTFDANDPSSIAAALVRLMTDRELQSKLRAAGPVRAAEFTWRRCAEETLAVYRKALA